MLVWLPKQPLGAVTLSAPRGSRPPRSRATALTVAGSGSCYVRRRTHRGELRPRPATHERQGRTLPPNDGPRIGLRAQLPLPPATQPGAATLARPLQQANATQLTSE